MKCLIIFLIRTRLGLKRNEDFRFANQRSEFDYYFFTHNALIKMKFCCSESHDLSWWQTEQSRCSLNWLLNDECEIVKLKDLNKGTHFENKKERKNNEVLY